MGSKIDKIVHSTTPKTGYANFVEPQFEIAAWSEDGAKPPSQVHLIIHWPATFGEGIPPMVIRFTQASVLRFFIFQLIRYYRHVWSDAEKIEGET